MFVGYPFQVSKQVAPSGRYVERVRAPVDGVAASLREPTLLEVVDERHYGTPVNPQREAEGLLGLALGGGEVAEHPEVPGMEAESGEALGELAMCVGTELYQEEATTAAQSPRRGRLRAGGISGHPPIIPPQAELFLI